MTEAQERALASEIRSWRRPDDAFIYELVVVGSGDEAVVAARLNPNLQACVITRRFSHRSRRDLSALAHFVDAHVSEDLADHTAEERAEILARAITESRPEIDLVFGNNRARGGGRRCPAGPALPPGVPRRGRHA